ncbi:uncharacterized protein LOC132605728 isoform X2 [Lycium barbarum]|uniref:uncharacterized protein LOC132605728 isoform X2 n=1 Tax=Lycium barbarum TaxID=112863 RepID=UPI00293F0C43|nr:uncharacterized protein LOC132605728 isoform X2 [Lycium barbarum]
MLQQALVTITSFSREPMVLLTEVPMTINRLQCCLRGKIDSNGCAAAFLEERLNRGLNFLLSAVITPLFQKYVLSLWRLIHFSCCCTVISCRAENPGCFTCQITASEHILVVDQIGIIGVVSVGDGVRVRVPV